jgi:formate hydrogenlyase transcriptional activator
MNLSSVSWKAFDRAVPLDGGAATHHLNGFDEIIGESPILRASLARVSEVAPTDATVLLLGETGTGKELFARALHDRSPRRARTLVCVNCAALPPTLIESELFGHERGAFTGAVAARQGRFELADRGTLFLDEIGDLPLELQAKLLRVIQEGEFERLGSSHKRQVDVRLIAATHCDLRAMAADGRFRMDLYYRLNVFPIRIPPLSDRREDIPRLVWHIIDRRQRALRRTIVHVPAPVMRALQQFDWPGNVRELENVVERAMIRSTGDTLLLHDDLVPASSAPAESSTALFVVERRHIEAVLQKCNWRINGHGNAAEQLCLHPNTLRFRMRKLGINRPSRILKAC